MKLLNSTLKNFILFLGISVLLLLLPLLFKAKDQKFKGGPKLKEVHYSEVSFLNEQDDIKLAGMLFLPKASEEFPLAITIQGSGDSRRSNSWYLSIVKHLQENGIAVLVPDKRGSEKSQGDWVGASFNTLATDSYSAIKYIKESSIKYSKLGIVGISQGGQIAAIVGAKEKDLSFIANVSGALTSIDEQLLYEEYHNIRPYTYNFIAKQIAPITTQKLKKKKTVAPLMGFDPIPYWKNVDTPVFIAYGEGDTNCPVDKSLRKIKANKLDHFKIQVYPSGGHAILGHKTTQISKIFLDDLVQFILREGK